MPDKYQNKYRIPSARLKGWDYARNAAYFITICTQHREHFFGEISNGEMHLTPIGEIAEQEWLKTPAVRPDMNLMLGAYVVMPNHVHGIIVIGDNEYNGVVQTRCIASVPTKPTKPTQPSRPIRSTIKKPGVYHARVQIICDNAGKKIW